MKFKALLAVLVWRRVSVPIWFNDSVVFRALVVRNVIGSSPGRYSTLIIISKIEVVLYQCALFYSVVLYNTGGHCLLGRTDRKKVSLYLEYLKKINHQGL